jgi:diacylglycerol kinase (ATP)
MPERFSLRGRARSFGHALRGLELLVRSQQNAWIHAGASAGVVALAFVLGISRGDWLWLMAAIAAVWAAEALNTAVESLADAAHPAPHPLVARAKDLGAAAVLIAALGAAGIGLLVLGPPLWARLAVWMR